jgi:hypothetical protein
MSYELVVKSKEGWINIGNAKFTSLLKALEYKELVSSELEKDKPGFSRDNLFIVKSEVVNNAQQ